MKKIMGDGPTAPAVVEGSAAKKAGPAAGEVRSGAEVTPRTPSPRGGSGRSDRQVGEAKVADADTAGRTDQSAKAAEAAGQPDGAASKTEPGAPAASDQTVGETQAVVDDDGKAARKKQIIDTAREAYVKEHGGKEGENKAEAEASFEQQRTILETSQDAEAILAAQENIGMPYGQLVEYLRGDDRRNEVGLTAALQGIGRTIDEIDADTSTTQQQKAQLKADVEKYRQALTDLFSSEERSARIEAAALFLPGAQEAGKSLEQYLERWGYTDEPSFFADVEAVGQAQGKLDSQEKPPTEPARAGDPDAVPLDTQAVEAQIQQQQAELDRSIAAQNDPHATEEEKEKARLNVEAIKKDLFKFYGKWLEILLSIGGGALAVVVVPTLLMASIHGGGGGK